MGCDGAGAADDETEDVEEATMEDDTRVGRQAEAVATLAVQVSMNRTLGIFIVECGCRRWRTNLRWSKERQCWGNKTKRKEKKGEEGTSER